MRFLIVKTFDLLSNFNQTGKIFYKYHLIINN